jgi:hypothetical protein
MAGASAKRRYERTDYERQVVQVARVCRRLEGGEDVTGICRDPTMPARTTLLSWLARHAELRARVEAAAAAAGPDGRRRAYHYYGEEIVAEFLARIEDGRGLAEVCAELDMPAHCTITRWLNERPEFAERYRWAREAQADRLFDLAWRIACEAEPGEVEVARLKINTIKWRIGRLVPRKYGPWKAVAAAAVDGGEDEAAPAETVMSFQVRHWWRTPDRRVVETTDVVRGLSPSQVAAVHQAVEAGRFVEGPDGQVAEVFWEDG